jgi:TRAP-type C4-dicarboxylate transport system permease small subunit
MVFLTGADVILRYFKRPIIGTYEIVALLGALMVGLSLPQTSRLKAHVLMDFVTSKLHGGLQKSLHVLTRAVGIVVFIVIGWNLWLLGDGYRKLGEGTLTLAIPLYPVAYAIAISCFVEIVVLFLELIEGNQQEAEK